MIEEEILDLRLTSPTGFGISLFIPLVLSEYFEYRYCRPPNGKFVADFSEDGRQLFFGGQT